MIHDDVTAIRNLLMAIRSSTLWDAITRQRIVGRIQLSRLSTMDWQDVFDESVPLNLRVSAFVCGDRDRLLDAQLASRLGLSRSEPLGVFDPIHFDGDVSQLTADYSFRDKLVRILRNHGYRSLAINHAPATDGLNHYNLYSQARTPVGQLASNFAESPDGTMFDTPHGPYRTLEGYYHVLRILDFFLSVEDAEEDYPLDHFDDIYQRDKYILDCFTTPYPDIERLAVVDGAEAIRLGRQVKKTIYGGTRYRPGKFSDHAEHCFMIAVVNKLHKLKIDGVCLGNVLSSIHHHKIPFVHYYVMDGQVKYPNHSEWLPNLYRGIAECIDPYSGTFNPEDVIKQLE